MAKIYGELVRRYRVAAGLTQEELAALSGLDVRTIGDIERGRTHRPHRSTVDLIARALGRDDLAYGVVRASAFARVAAAGHPPGTPEHTDDLTGVLRRAIAVGQVSSAEQGGVRLLPVVDVLPVAIGHYADPELTDLDVEVQVGRLVDLLAPFGGQHRPWRHPVRDRGADAVQRRLREWSYPEPSTADAAGLDRPSTSSLAASSVLYWAGHGWSDGTHAALAHGESPAVVGASGVEPQQLAQAIRARQATVESFLGAGDPGGWAIVIIETSRAAQIGDAVMAALHRQDAPGRLLLVAVPNDVGSTGRFVGVLENLLADTYLAERRIRLRDLAAQLERVLGPRNVHQRALGEAALVRMYPPAASWMSAPVDAIRYLEDILEDLSPDERSHFVAKAQAAERGEMSWFFEGRQDELAQISTWLHQADSGMLVVTGRAGSGKSALLGTVLVRSLPALRDALARRGLVAAAEPGAAVPPESAFDVVIHLSGLDLAQAVTRAASAAGTGPLPSHRDPEAGVASDLDFLAEELAGRVGPFTVLADALDESLDPLDIAGSLLARFAVLPRVRILVGTRASTNDGPDAPAADENLLDALGTGTRPDGISVIRVGQDEEAIRRYVTGRLRSARDYGLAGRAIPHMRAVSDQDIQRVAGEVASAGQEFLFARLAVYELIADPRLLTPGLALSRSQLLQGTHQDLFGRALHRLAGYDDRYPVLMRALSLARGRGLPEADGIWAIIATALAVSSDFGAAADWAAAVSGLLSRAAAYIIADTSTGCGGPPGQGSAGQRTVYRLAHRTFVEYFGKHSRHGQDSGDSGKLAARALLHAASQAAAGPDRLSDYLVTHLSGHTGEAGMWDDLASLPHVLDRIDPNAVTADAIRTLLGRRTVPPSIAGVIGARDALVGASAADRPGVRQLASTIYSARQVIGEPVTGWGIAAAQAGRATVHVRLNGHASTVNKVLGLTLPGGRVVLASCGDDGAIRLWDPLAASPVGVPMKAHTSTIDDICVLPGRGGRILLAGAGEDGTVRLWDPVSGQPAGPVITGHVGSVLGVCVVPGSEPGQPLVLASAGLDGTVRLWDPASGQPAGPVITGHAGPVWSVCVVPGGEPGEPSVLASAGGDGTVRLWDPASGQPAGPVMTAPGPILGMCVVPGREPSQPLVLASAGLDGTVRLWDPASGQPAGPVITGHAGAVWSVCVVPGREPGRPLALASAGEDGTVRLWDPASGQLAGPVITAHAGGVLDVCVVPGGEPGQPSVLASAGSDGTVRLWDLVSGQPADPVTTASGPVLGLCVVPGREPGEPAVLASAGSDGTVRLWDPASGQPAGPVITAHTDAVLTVCVVPARAPGQPPALASGGRHGTVRLWDPASGQPAGPVITGHAGPVRSICVVSGGQPGRPAVVASGGFDGTVRLWDPASGQSAGPVITAHTDGVLSVCVVSGGQLGRPAVLASSGFDGTVRLWDPVSGQPAGPVITGHAGAVWNVCEVPGREPGQPPTLASAGEDGAVRLWDPASGRPAGPVISAHAGGVLDVCVVSGGEPGQPPALASAGSDGTVQLWDLASGQPAGPVITGHAGHVRSICVVPGGEPGQPSVLASAGLDGTVRLWNPATGRAIGEPLIRSAEAVSGLARCAAAIGDCVTMHGDGMVNTWTAATATLRVVRSAPDVCSIATLITAGHLLLTGDIYGRVHLSDLRTGHQPGSPLQVDHRAVLAICPLPGKPSFTRAAVASGSGTATIITVLPDGELEAGPILPGPASPIRALCAITSPNGQGLLAAAGNDATIWIWDLATIEASTLGASLRPAPLKSRLTGHDGRIWSLAAVPAGPGRPPCLVSAGADHTVRLWDPASGRALGQPMAGHTDQVRAVITSTSDDGRVVLVSGGHDGTVRLWDPATGTQLAVIPLGIPVHALLQQPPDPVSVERTGGGATITIGLRTGILALDLHRHLFQSAPRLTAHAPTAARRSCL